MILLFQFQFQFNLNFHSNFLETTKYGLNVFNFKKFKISLSPLSSFSVNSNPIPKNIARVRLLHPKTSVDRCLIFAIYYLLLAIPYSPIAIY